MTAKEVFEQYKDGLITLAELLLWCAGNVNLMTPADTQEVLTATVNTLKRDVPLLYMVASSKSAQEAVNNLMIEVAAVEGDHVMGLNG